MRSLGVLALFCLLGAGSLGAILPPVYESVKEYKALLDDRQLTEKLGSGESILAIKRIDQGFFILTTRYTMSVDVIYDPTERIGPAAFHLVFHEPSLR